jgi:hypothetical protein
MKPLIRRSDLSDPPRYYVLTRYRIDGNTVIASTKYDVTDQIEALLASGTGEPGLDVERLARSLRALEARDELTVADGFLGGRDDGDYVTFATSIAAAYANDKGADPTPEPK